MEKTEVIQVLTDKTKHSFYCDDCGKFLLESLEDDDGYYEEPSGFRCLGLNLNGHHCEECGKKRVQSALNFMKNMGFI